MLEDIYPPAGPSTSESSAAATAVPTPAAQGPHPRSNEARGWKTAARARVLTVDSTVVDCKLQVGELQREKTFPAQPKPGEIAVPFFDREPDDPAHYFGQAKGMKQVLWERGWWPSEVTGVAGTKMKQDDMAVAL
jgi:hypothetical protein